MKKNLIRAIATFLAITTVLMVTVSAEPGGDFVVTEDFVDYIKNATNPDQFGLAEDGRFYPYSSPEGRRIGYRQEIVSKDFYLEGWLKEEAEEKLRRELEETAERLNDFLARRFGIQFKELSRNSQEILVDFAHSEGVENLSEVLVRGAADMNWKVLLDPAVYVRTEADWPDLYRNRAFMERWGEKGGAY